MSDLTPSNTDTELSQLVDEIVSIIDNDGPSSKTERTVKALIARRDTEKRDSLLKAVRAWSPTTDKGKHIYLDDLEQIVESIYRGTQQ